MVNRKRYMREYSKRWREENKEKIKKHAKEYRKNNFEKIKKRTEIWYENNKEKVREYKKQYRENNFEKVKEYMKKYRKDNCEELSRASKIYRLKNFKKEKEYKRLYYIKNRERFRRYSMLRFENNREKIMEYRKRYMAEKRKINPKFNLNCKMSIIIRYSLKGNKNGKHWETLVNFTLKDLIKRLKQTMPKGYTWQDFMEGKLHIDHIVPISAFNFTESKHIDFKRCWALKNLRLLPARENIIKSNKLSRPFQPALIF